MSRAKFLEGPRLIPLESCVDIVDVMHSFVHAESCFHVSNHVHHVGCQSFSYIQPVKHIVEQSTMLLVHRTAACNTTISWGPALPACHFSQWDFRTSEHQHDTKMNIRHADMYMLLPKLKSTLRASQPFADCFQYLLY